MSQGIDIDRVHAQPARKPRTCKPLRDLILAKVNKAGGMSRAGIIARIEHSRRDDAALELDRMVAEGVVFKFSRPAISGGMSAVSFFACKADGLRWQGERDGRAVQKPKPARLAKPLAPVQEQTVGLGWRNLKPAKDTPAVTPNGLKPQVLDSQPVYSRHQVKPGELVPSVISSAECRPWARQCLGGAV